MKRRDLKSNRGFGQNPYILQESLDTVVFNIVFGSP